MILANEVIGDQALVREIVRHIEGRPAQVRIVAPALVKSPLDLAAGDVDDEIDEPAPTRSLDRGVRPERDRGHG